MHCFTESDTYLGWDVRNQSGISGQYSGTATGRPAYHITMGADAELLAISLMDLISKRIRVIGSQQNGPEYLYEALDFVAQGKVKTIVETYPLAEAPKAYQRVVEGKARFRAVLTM